MKLMILLLFSVYSLAKVDESIKKEAEKLFIQKYEIRETKGKKKDIKNIIYTLKYKEAKDVIEFLKNINDIKISFIDNKLIISGDIRQIEEVVNIIKKIDVNERQIFIQLTIIDTSNNLFDRLGISWKLKEKGILNLLKDFSISNLINNASNILDIDFEALRQKGDILVKSVPTIIVVDGNTAKYKLTDEYIIKHNKKNINNIEAGIILEILPKIKNDYIQLNIKTEISSFNSKMSKKKNYIETLINVENSKPKLISSLKSVNKSNNIEKTPLVSDIPIIGSLFKYKNNSNQIRELYIEIMAKII